MADWELLRNEYVHGLASLRALARKYGVSRSTLESHSAREAWGYARQRYRESLEQSGAGAAAFAAAEAGGGVDPLLDALYAVYQEALKDLIDVYRAQLQEVKHRTIFASGEVDPQEYARKIDELAKAGQAIARCLVDFDRQRGGRARSEALIRARQAEGLRRKLDGEEDDTEVNVVEIGACHWTPENDSFREVEADEPDELTPAPEDEPPLILPEAYRL